MQTFVEMIWNHPYTNSSNSTQVVYTNTSNMATLEGKYNMVINVTLAAINCVGRSEVTTYIFVGKYTCLNSFINMYVMELGPYSHRHSFKLPAASYNWNVGADSPPYKLLEVFCSLWAPLPMLMLRNFNKTSNKCSPILDYPDCMTTIPLHMFLFAPLQIVVLLNSLVIQSAL